MSHAELFSERVLLNLESPNKDAALHELCDHLISSGAVAEKYRDDLIKAILEREKLGSTGIGGGVAMPHVKIDVVDDSVGALAIVRDGIDYAAVDGEKVKIIFLVVSPVAKTEQHLDIIRWIARVARHRDCQGFMLSAKSGSDAVSSLSELGA